MTDAFPTSAVLDGGLPKWIAEGRETEDLPPMMRDRHMTVQRQAGLVKDVTQVAHAVKLRAAEVTVLRFPTRKNETDMELALTEAIRRGTTRHSPSAPSRRTDSGLTFRHMDPNSTLSPRAWPSTRRSRAGATRIVAGPRWPRRTSRLSRRCSRACRNTARRA